jgi:hypothetical protein
MTMHKINQHRSGNRSPMRVGVTAIVPLAAFVPVVAACGDDDGNDEVTVEFTGDDCIYSGPDEFEVGDEIEITASDVTEERVSVGFGVVPVPAGTSVADVREKGIEEVLGQDAGDFDEAFLFSEVTEEGTVRVLSTPLDVAGTWLVNCFIFSGAGAGDYPATTFEVVEKS